MQRLSTPRELLRDSRRFASKPILASIAVGQNTITKCQSNNIFFFESLRNYYYHAVSFIFLHNNYLQYYLNSTTIRLQLFMWKYSCHTNSNLQNGLHLTHREIKCYEFGKMSVNKISCCQSGKEKLTFRVTK